MATTWSLLTVVDENVVAFDIEVYRSDDDQTLGEVVAYEWVDETADLAVGTGHRVSIEGVFADSSDGSGLIVKLDARSDLEETDESNNMAVFDGGTFLIVAGTDGADALFTTTADSGASAADLHEEPLLSTDTQLQTDQDADEVMGPVTLSVFADASDDPVPGDTSDDASMEHKVPDPFWLEDVRNGFGREFLDSDGATVGSEEDFRSEFARAGIVTPSDPEFKQGDSETPNSADGLGLAADHLEGGSPLKRDLPVSGASFGPDGQPFSGSGQQGSGMAADHVDGGPAVKRDVPREEWDHGFPSPAQGHFDADSAPRVDTSARAIDFEHPTVAVVVGMAPVKQDRLPGRSSDAKRRETDVDRDSGRSRGSQGIGEKIAAEAHDKVDRERLASITESTLVPESANGLESVGLALESLEPVAQLAPMATSGGSSASGGGSSSASGGGSSSASASGGGSSSASASGGGSSSTSGGTSSSASGGSASGAPSGYVLDEGYVVDFTSPFVPTVIGNYNTTPSGPTTTTTTESFEENGVTFTSTTVDDVTLTITSTAGPSDAWTYNETLVSTYTVTMTGTDGSSSESSGDYNYTFTSSGGATGSTYTFTADGGSSASGSFTETWSSGGWTETLTYEWDWSTNFDDTISNTWDSAAGTGSGTSEGSASTEWSHSASGTYSYTFDGGSVSGTISDSAKDTISYEYDTTSSYNAGAWSIDGGSATYGSSGNAEYTISGSGSYSDSGDIVDDTTDPPTSYPWSLSFSFSEDVTYSTDYDESTDFTINADGAWEPTTATASGNVTFDSSYSGDGSYSYSFDGNSMEYEYSDSWTDNISYDYDIGSTYAPADGTWTDTGTGTLTEDGNSAFAYSGTNTITLSGDDWSFTGTVTDNATHTVANYTYTTNFVLDSDGVWDATGGSGGANGSGNMGWSYVGEGSFSYPITDGSVSGTFTQNDNDTSTYLFNTTATFADDVWTESGSLTEFVSGSRNSTSDVTLNISSSGDGWSYTGSGTQTDNTNHTYNGTVFYSPSASGWEMYNLSIGGTGSGNSNWNYDGNGTYSYGVGISTVNGTFSDHSDDTTTYSYIFSDNYALGAWNFIGSGPWTNNGNSNANFSASGAYVTSDGIVGTTDHNRSDTATYNYTATFGRDPDEGIWRWDSGNGTATGNGTEDWGKSASGSYTDTDDFSYTITGTKKEDVSEDRSYNYTITSTVDTDNLWVHVGTGDSGGTGTAEFHTSGSGKYTAFSAVGDYISTFESDSEERVNDVADYQFDLDHELVDGLWEITNGDADESRDYDEFYSFKTTLTESTSWSSSSSSGTTESSSYFSYSENDFDMETLLHDNVAQADYAYSADYTWAPDPAASASASPWFLNDSKESASGSLDRVIDYSRTANGDWSYAWGNDQNSGGESTSSYTLSDILYQHTDSKFDWLLETSRDADDNLVTTGHANNTVDASGQADYTYDYNANGSSWWTQSGSDGEDTTFTDTYADTYHHDTHDDYDYDYSFSETYSATGTQTTGPTQTNDTSGTTNSNSNYTWTWTNADGTTSSSSWSSNTSDSYNETVEYPGFYDGMYYHGAGSGHAYYIGDLFSDYASGYWWYYDDWYYGYSKGVSVPTRPTPPTPPPAATAAANQSGSAGGTSDIEPAAVDPPLAMTPAGVESVAESTTEPVPLDDSPDLTSARQHPGRGSWHRSDLNPGKGRGPRHQNGQHPGKGNGQGLAEAREKWIAHRKNLAEAREKWLAKRNRGNSGSNNSSWKTVTDAAAYNNDYHRVDAATEPVATWTLTGLDPTKTYQVLATWPVDPTNATATEWNVYNGSTDAAVLASVAIDQTELRADAQLDGIDWQTLGIVTPASGTLVIQLEATDADGQLTADAVRVIETTPNVTREHDATGNLTSETDALGHQTTYTYDTAGNPTSVTDPNGDVTHFEYDPAGNLTAVIDPLGNRTDFAYNPQGQLLQESVTTEEGVHTRTYQYDASGNLTQKTDRNNRITVYTYDESNRITQEIWYNNVADTEADQNRSNTITYSYDTTGALIAASDNSSSYTYTYDTQGRVTTTTTTHPDAPVTVLTTDYGTRQDNLPASQTATVNNQPDFQNTYQYDYQGRLVDIRQTDQGEHPTPEKQVKFQYNQNGQLQHITRRVDSHRVATTTYQYDTQNRLTTLTHHQNPTAPLAEYTYQYDAAGRPGAFTSSLDVQPAPLPDHIWQNQTTGNLTQLTSPDGTTTYEHDARSQLTGADYDYQPNESYSYDVNGNRTNDGYETGDYNQLLSDGTYRYEYDPEGNRTRRTDLATGQVTEYEWDHRNRLISVIDRAAADGPVLQSVEYVYDYLNRWIAKSIDVDGDGPFEFTTTHLVHDGTPPDEITLDRAAVSLDEIGQIVLQLDETGAVQNRYLWGPAVDQILADEQMQPDGSSELLWTLTDHLGTVRDLAVHAPQTDVTTIANHLIYDAYGNIQTQTNSAVTTLFAFTGRPFDSKTDLQNNLNRWYDATIGQWLSQDPITFTANDVNLYRHVANSSINAADPTGLVGDVGAQMFSNALGELGQAVSDGWDQLWDDITSRLSNENVQVQQGIRLQPGESLDAYVEPGGPSDLPKQLKGKWKISLVAGYGHAYIRLENLDTGETHTLSKYKAGYGGRYDEEGNLVAAVAISGIQWDKDLIKEEGFKAGKFRRTSVVVQDPEIYQENKYGYHSYNDNCVTYSRDAWYYYSGSYAIMPGPDLPSHLEGYIKCKTGGISNWRGSVCFREGTQVHTETGLQDIETVSIGTRVWSYDHKQQAWGMMSVLDTEAHDFVGVMVKIRIGQETIEATTTHPFWVISGESLETRPNARVQEGTNRPSIGKGRWVAAGELQSGDVLLARDGQLMTIASTKAEEMKVRIHNLLVERFNNYAVGNAGLLVNNM